MNVSVDSDLCVGYGMCADAAPALFHLDEEGYAYVEGEGEVPPEQEDVALRAALACPMNAILYEE